MNGLAVIADASSQCSTCRQRILCIVVCKDNDRRAGWATVNDSITGRFDFHRKPAFQYAVITVLEVFPCTYMAEPCIM